MNPGPQLGLIAVVAAYALVLGGLLVYLKMTSSRQKRLEQRKRELKS
jgi:hypothetical protein